eukprot:scaffold173472_cov30-Tisochrysis_lutea.AAC.1
MKRIPVTVAAALPIFLSATPEQNPEIEPNEAVPAMSSASSSVGIVCLHLSVHSGSLGGSLNWPIQSFMASPGPSGPEGQERGGNEGRGSEGSEGEGAGV